MQRFSVTGTMRLVCNCDWRVELAAAKTLRVHTHSVSRLFPFAPMAVSIVSLIITQTPLDLCSTHQGVSDDEAVSDL